MTKLLGGLSHLIPGRRIGGRVPDTQSVMRWVYIGRVAVAIGVFIAAAFFFHAIPPGVLLMVSVAALLSVMVSVVSAWFTEVKKVGLNDTFIYLQAMFDLGLVTTVVHVTGGVESDFASLYILVIVASSLLLPVASSLLITVLAGILYFAVIFFFNQPQLSADVAMQLAVFAAVALASSGIARRARIAGNVQAVLEQEVARLRLEASDILRNLRSGIISIDQDGYLIFANPAAERLLHFNADSMVGREVADFLAERAPGLATSITRTLQAGLGVQRFEAVITAGGKTFPIGVTTTLLDMDDDDRMSVTAIFTDISDQMRLEELKLRNERLEAVAELSASLAHEIKNPLASIRSSVEQLGRSMQAGEDERFLSQLVVRESDRLSGLLSEFLDFARVRVTERAAIDLGELASSVAAILRTHPDCHPDSEILVDADPVELEGDSDLLHRVLFNLILNGLQATGAGAVIRVEVKRGFPADSPPGVWVDSPVYLRVTDNGPGVPRELLPRLFDPFVTGRVGGSGLGLAIVQRAVEAHSGVVFVESSPGAGSSFVVLLPGGGKKEVMRESA